MNRRARGLLAFALFLLPACQQQMASQPSYRPDEASSFFADGRTERPVVPGTIARGHLRKDHHLYAGTRTPRATAPPWAAAVGLLGAAEANPVGALAAASTHEEYDYVDTFPFPVTEAVLKHGQDRYMIYCVVCHDPLGTGRGKIVERGYTPPPSYHIERLRKAPVGHFYDVITRGYGSMPEYRAQIPPRDRWAIAAYIRALQLSQHFPVKQLPEDMRREWVARNESGKVEGRQP
jgi:mono/diheme cytochrome c family protein